ncbi:ABC transporter permease [Sphingobacterium kyonggiense]
MRNKFFSLLTVVGLAVGFAISMLALSYWTAEKSINQWNSEKENIYQIVRTPLSKEYSTAYQPNIMSYYLKQKDLIADYCYLDGFYHQESYAFKGKVVNTKKNFRSQGNFFEYFPFEKITGSYQGFKETVDAIALEESYAISLFGNLTAGIDQIITDSYGKAWTVKLIYRLNAKSSVLPIAINTYWNKNVQTEDYGWFNFGAGSLIKLKENVSKETLTKEIYSAYESHLLAMSAKNRGISLEAYKEEGNDIIFTLEPLSRLYQESKASLLPEGLSNHLFLYLNIGFAGLILLLSLINFINLTATQALKRGKEMGLRRVMGSNSWTFYLQYLFETSLIFVSSFVLALVLVEWTSPFYNQLLNFDIVVGLKEISIFFISMILMVLVVSSFPALFLSNIHLQNMLKGQYGSSKAGKFVRNASLVLQFAIATFFILVSVNANKQIDFLGKMNLGFTGDQIIRINFQPNQKKNAFEFYKTFEQELRKVPGVQDLSVTNFSLSDGVTVSSTTVNYQTNTSQVTNIGMDEHFLDMLQIKLAAGRSFDSKLASDSLESILLNETAVNELKMADPLNKVIKWWGKDRRIIGVVKDFNSFDLEQNVNPMIFVNLNGNPDVNAYVNSIYVKMDVSKFENGISALESFWKKRVDQYFPFEYEFVDKAFANTYAKYVQQRNLFNILNSIVVFIALLGLFALASFTIERKFKEIAIRKVLGAETPNLLKQLTMVYFILFLLGFLLTVVPSYYLIQSWLENFAYRIEISWISYLIAFVGLLLLTMVTVLSKAYKATKINTLSYLKYE